MVRVDTAPPGKVGDKAGQVAEEAEDAAADVAPIIPEGHDLPADQARHATTRMAFTLRPWTIAIAPR